MTLSQRVGAALGLSGLVPLTGGRTNAVWRCGARVVKLYQPSGITPLFGNAPEDEWRVLTALSGTGLAPEPIQMTRIPEGEILIYAHVEGAPGWDDPASAAELLWQVHSQRPVPALRETSADDLVHCGLRMLPDGHALASRKPIINIDKKSHLIHRDPIFSNFVTGPSGRVLVDWQCPAIGDPVEDLAHFLSPAMNILYRGKLLSSEERTRFLDAYPERQTAAQYAVRGKAYHWRLACYCVWQVARGNFDYAPALRAELDLLGGEDLGAGQSL